MRHNKGFLLLEVIVSIVVITGGLLFVMRTYAASKDAITRSRDSLKASLLMEEQLFRFEEKGEAKEGAWEGEVKGTGTLSWKIKSVPAQALDLNLVMLSVFRRHDLKQGDSICMYLKKP